MDVSDSGIIVIETPSRGQVIPAARETVTAFVGPAPRGPVDMPVAVASVEEFLRRFGVAGRRSRLELLLQQYFDNGGRLAVVVRVTRSRRRNRIVLPGAAGDLVLDALNPGPFEYLRASVDYEGVPADARDRFNLVVHRCRSPEQPFVEEQEIYHDVSVLPSWQGDYVGDVLLTSHLVRLHGDAPRERPRRTLGPDAGGAPAWVFCRAEAQDPVAPTDYDLIGSPEEGTGLFALDQVPCVDVVCLLPGAADGDLGPVALFAAERYARSRQALLLLDPPRSWHGPGEIVRAQHQRGFASADAFTYWPFLEPAADAGFGDPLSAAGAIAGVIAAGDRAAGPWASPAPHAALATGRHRPAQALDEQHAGQLVHLGVNVLARGGGQRTELHGAVTLARFGGLGESWNDLRRRRTALFILGSIGRYTHWSAFAEPGPELWRDVKLQVRAFLSGLRDRGALAGDADRRAFYVKCDADTNPARGDGAHRVVLLVGLALHYPGEFVAFRIVHDAAGWHLDEPGLQPGLALTG